MQYSHLSDEAYARHISNHMTVPLRIRATGDIVDDDTPHMNGWDYKEKFDMNVPDRIMLVGDNQHLGFIEISTKENGRPFRDRFVGFTPQWHRTPTNLVPDGTRAPPREISLENSIQPPDPGSVRVSTPPRVITLDHYFPSADDAPTSMGSPPSARLATGEPGALVASTPRPNDYYDTPVITNNQLALRDVTPPFNSGEGLSMSEEVVHLRRQIARLNRRVMTIEMDSVQRQQKDRIMTAIGIAYVIFKVIAWLNRS